VRKEDERKSRQKGFLIFFKLRLLLTAQFADGHCYVGCAKLITI